MLLIDTLTASDQGAGTVETVLSATSVAANADQTLSPLIHVELMAQAYAAVKGWEIMQAGLDFPIGFLVGVQKFTLHNHARAGEHLTIDVTTAGEFEGFAIVEGTVSCGETAIASGKIKLWVPQEDA